jgi:hypothetical protein
MSILDDALVGKREGERKLTSRFVCFVSRSSGLPPSSECFLFRLLNRLCIVIDILHAFAGIVNFEKVKRHGRNLVTFQSHRNILGPRADQTFRTSTSSEVSFEK